MTMKIYLTVLLLLGVITMEGKPQYRIQTWKYNGTTYYLPQKRVWASTNYFKLPYKVWKSSEYPFHNKWDAESVIETWKQLEREARRYRKSEYVYVD